MINKTFVFGALLFCINILASPVLADTAVVVGVNNYSKLGEKYGLAGCVNDANLMKSKLELYGFSRVVFLSDEQATKSKILEAIKSSGNKKNERFVFYFAGHGTNSTSGGAIILPSDASLADTSADLTADELKKAIDAVQGSTKTVILDSCFSGGMTRVAKGLNKVATLRTRFVQRASSSSRPARVSRGGFRTNDNSKDLIRANSDGGDGGSDGKTGNVCYVVGAGPNEKAAEDVFDGKSGGVFTHFLGKHLDKSKEKWGDVMNAVTGDVQEYLEGIQRPEMTPDFRGKVVFDGGDGKVEPDPKPNSLWELYHSDQPDPSLVSLMTNPDTAEFEVGSIFTLQATVGKKGYLVVIEKGTSGRINLLYPASASADDALVEAGQKSLGRFTPNATGTEHVKAIWFPNKASAKVLVDAFPVSATGRSTRSMTLTEIRNKRINLRDLEPVRDNDPRTFVTSDVTFGVFK